MEGGATGSGSAYVDLLQDPWDGMEAVWPLDEEGNGTPDEYKDRTRHHYDGTGQGEIPELETGVFCLGCQGFHGDSWISIPQDSMGCKQDFTISLWANVEGLYRQRAFYSRGHTDGTNDWVTLFGHSVANHAWLSLHTTDGTIEDQENGFSDMLPRDKWHHLAASWDGEKIKMYVNGDLQQEWDCTNSQLVPLANSGFIGAVNWGGSPEASVQEVRLHPVAREATWLKAEHDAFCSPDFYSALETEGTSIYSSV